MEPIPLKAARYDFSAARDENGVPHVEAPAWREALYAWGYLHALDRPTQLYFSRAVASGRAAERIANKPELLEADMLLRRAGLYRNLDLEFKRLPESTRQQLDWYCQGVNDGLLAAGRTLPMWVTGFQPRPWEPVSVMLIGKLLSFAGLTVGEQENERLLLEFVQLGIDEERLRELFYPYLDGIDFEPLREIRIAKRLSDEALELLADLPRLAGSNAWAVSPARSASGHALLASDPHLEVNRLPPIWYEVALNWGDDQYAMGATLPGCPIMAVGRTNRLAWGVTYMHADTSDFFIEDCRPGGTTGWQYRRSQRWFDFQLRQEVIRRKGAEPYILDVYENEQGTLSVTPNPAEGPGKYIVGFLDRRTGGRRAGDRHVARCGLITHNGRRHGKRPHVPASVAGVGVRRLRGAHRPAGERLAAAARSRQLGHHAGRRVGRAKSLARPRAARSVAARIRPADRLRGQRQRRTLPPRRTAAARARPARLSQTANRRAAHRDAAGHARRHAIAAVRRAQLAGPRPVAGAARAGGRLSAQGKALEVGLPLHAAEHRGHVVPAFLSFACCWRFSATKKASAGGGCCTFARGWVIRRWFSPRSTARCGRSLHPGGAAAAKRRSSNGRPRRPSASRSNPGQSSTRSTS